MEKKSRILIIGVTGNLGFQIAKTSLHFSHPTFALFRDSAFSDPIKSQKLHSLSNSGATLLKGSLEDEASLIEAIKQVDVVVSAVSSKQVLAQKLLISAIKQAGCIKRFIPSEFGADPDKVQILNMAYNFYTQKAEIRRLVEAEGIPYTIISCNFFMSFLIPSLVQPDLETPPRDKATIFGYGNTKGVFVKESDVAAFTISAVDDPRTLNKVVYLRPPGNVYSVNELIEIWESKIGKKLEKIYEPEEELLKKIKEIPYPENMKFIFLYSAFIKGDHTYFDIELSGGVDGTKLYPQLKYTTISEYLDTLLQIPMEAKCKVLIIGGTGYFGKFMVEASAKSGHPTFAFVRESTLCNPAKTKIIHKFVALGISFLFGDLYDHRSLVRAIKEVDVVISTVGHHLLADQDKIIAAIKEAGNIKRFLPSEFGSDADHVHAVDPLRSTYAIKARTRRMIEAEKIPYTIVSSNLFASFFLPTLAQTGASGPPKEKVVILGDGNLKAIFNREEDIGIYTMRAVDDPRTLNKILYIKPPGNIYSFNDLVSLWEKKIGKTLERIYVPEEQLLKNIKEASPPLNVILSVYHSVFVKGDQTNFEIDPSLGVEASQLYPDVKYISVDEFINQFV